MFLLRQGKLADLPFLDRLLEQLGYKLAPAILIQNIKAYLEDGDRELIVAEFEGRVVGCVALDIAQTFHREGKQMRIVSLVVDHAFHRKGLGKLLLKAVEKLAKQRNCWVVEVTSSMRRQKDGTHDFYTSQGFMKNESQVYFHKKNF